MLDLSKFTSNKKILNKVVTKLCPWLNYLQMVFFFLHPKCLKGTNSEDNNFFPSFSKESILTFKKE